MYVLRHEVIPEKEKRVLTADKVSFCKNLSMTLYESKIDLLGSGVSASAMALGTGAIQRVGLFDFTSADIPVSEYQVPAARHSAVVPAIVANQLRIY